MHAAAFLGRVEVAKLLLQYGANPEAKNNNGDTPRTVLEVDWELTRYLAGLLQVELDARQVEDGRVEIAGLFEQSPTDKGQEKTDKAVEESAEFLKAMAAPIFAVPLFHHLCTRENKTIRYASDSSYWLYVAHVPLIIGAQLAVRDWPLASGVKYFIVLLAVTGLLLLTYRFLVRYTWLGRLLNGPRVRPTS